MDQLLRDSNILPTDDIIAQGLGDSFKAFKKLIQGLELYDISLMEWRYYNDSKAWLTKGEYKWTTPRGANKVKPVFWLSVWEGFFKVSFFFSSDIKNELLKLPISGDAKASIENAKAMGKTMRFLPVILSIADETQLNDIYELAQFRKSNVK